MKRILIIAAVAALITLLFTGCKKPENSANGNTPMPGQVFSQTF